MRLAERDLWAVRPEVEAAGGRQCAGDSHLSWCTHSFPDQVVREVRGEDVHGQRSPHLIGVDLGGPRVSYKWS